MNTDKKAIAIKYPPSGKEVYFDDGSWTNNGAETKKYTEKSIILYKDISRAYKLLEKNNNRIYG